MAKKQIKRKTKRLEKEVKILKRIIEKGKLTAYETHRKTGYPLSTTQHILKQLEKDENICVIEHQKTKGQLEKKYYDITFMGVLRHFVCFNVSERVSFLDKHGLPKFSEMIERGIKTTEKAVCDAIASKDFDKAMALGAPSMETDIKFMRTAIKLDEWLATSEENREWCKEIGICPHDFIISTALRIVCGSVQPQTISTYKRPGDATILRQAIIVEDSSSLSKGQQNALDIVMWKSGYLSEVSKTFSEAAEHFKSMEEMISKECKDIIPEILS